MYYFPVKHTIYYIYDLCNICYIYYMCILMLYISSNYIFLSINPKPNIYIPITSYQLPFIKHLNDLYILFIPYILSILYIIFFSFISYFIFTLYVL